MRGVPSHCPNEDARLSSLPSEPGEPPDERARDAAQHAVESPDAAQDGLPGALAGGLLRLEPPAAERGVVLREVEEQDVVVPV